MKVRLPQTCSISIYKTTIDFKEHNIVDTGKCHNPQTNNRSICSRKRIVKLPGQKTHQRETPTKYQGPFLGEKEYSNLQDCRQMQMGHLKQAQGPFEWEDWSSFQDSRNIKGRASRQTLGSFVSEHWVVKLQWGQTHESETLRPTHLKDIFLGIKSSQTTRTADTW